MPSPRRGQASGIVGLFRRKNSPPVAAKPKPFRIELGWRGMFGLVVVCFCLFLWMFLLGLWAGQTILLPPRGNQVSPVTESSKPSTDGTLMENGTSQRQQRTPVP